MKPSIELLRQRILEKVQADLAKAAKILALKMQEPPKSKLKPKTEVRKKAG